MSDMMTTSQKHLNSIKSVFGGFKNWWSGGKKSHPETEQPRQSKLRETVERERQSGPHPALKLKSEDGRGFYDNDEDLDSRFMAGSKVNGKTQQHSGPMLQKVTNSEKEKRLDQNLGNFVTSFAEGYKANYLW